jgi:hypothetical protein
MVKLFSYSGTIRFKSNTTIDNAIGRLKDLGKHSTSDPGFELTRSELYVQINGKEVILHRIRDVVGNYLYKPIFIGHFIARDGEVFLEGSFLMSRITPVWFVVATSVILLLEALFISAALQSTSAYDKALEVLSLPVAYACAVAGLLAIKGLFAQDMAWIQDRIERALE